MGVAVLSGILSSLTTINNSQSSSTTSDDLPPQLPSSFIAAASRPVSEERLHKQLDELVSSSKSTLKVICGDNVTAAKESDLVVLGCKPYMAEGILEQEGMNKALQGKTVVSMLAGMKISQLEELAGEGVRVVRAMPNTASKIRQGMTVISAPPTLPDSERKLIFWMFSQIGRCTILEEKHMDACTAMGGSGPAFMMMILEAISDGGVMMGLPRQEAITMAAQVMQGAARMVLETGEHPAVLREQVTTPGGCTIKGLMTLEEGNLRATVSKGIIDATNWAAGLGKK